MLGPDGLFLILQAFLAVNLIRTRECVDMGQLCDEIFCMFTQHRGMCGKRSESLQNKTALTGAPMP